MFVLMMLSCRKAVRIWFPSNGIISILFLVTELENMVGKAAISPLDLINGIHVIYFIARRSEIHVYLCGK